MTPDKDFPSHLKCRAPLGGRVFVLNMGGYYGKKEKALLHERLACGKFMLVDWGDSTHIIPSAQKAADELAGHIKDWHEPEL